MPNSIKCQRCLRTFVNYVSGLYNTEEGLNKKICKNGPIAQLGARLNGIEKVESSNLSGSTKDSRKAVFV